MILTGDEIASAVQGGSITLEPFSEELLNPNSYNYRLGEQLLVVDDDVIDLHSKSQTSEIIIPSEGYTLEPGRLYLGHTSETIGSDQYVPSLIGRSSLGRLGLFLQITADLGHLGTCHKWTLELTVVQPLTVYPGMRIGQVSFWKPVEIESLAGDSYLTKPMTYANHSQATPAMHEKLFR
jgi:dCTP deaminase